MNARLAAALLVLLAALGGGALLVRNEADSRKSPDAGTLGQPLLKGLQASQVASISIRQPRGAITIARKDERWTIAERDGFPADYDKVRSFVLQALSLKVGQSEPIGDKDRARLLLDAGGTAIEFLGADGKPLARLTAGKKYYKREVENPDKAPADGRFVGLPGEPGQAYLVSDALAQASTRSADWIDRSSFQVEKVKTLEVRYPGGGGWRIERNADNAEWKLEGARPGEKLDVGRANAASYSLSLLELADVAPKDAKHTGLESPTLVNATTLAGRAYAIKVGRLEGENYYLSLQSSGADERPREKLQSQHVLLVPRSKLEDTLKKRADLLEKKEDTKK